MSQHATDRWDWTVIAACENNLEHLELEASAECSKYTAREALPLDECGICGADLNSVIEEEPTEVLTDGGTDAEDVDEKYRKVLASLSSGLLVTVNCSNKWPFSYDEMTVQGATDDGEVDLEGRGSRRYRIYFHDELGPRIEKLDDDGFGDHDNPIETIEVIGHV